MVIKEKHISAQPAVSPSNGNVLLDQYGRVFDYLRIAVNEQCNLRCLYCMPEEGIHFQPAEKRLKANEMFRLIRIASSLGVRKVRFTGGEPLIYKDLIPLIREVATVPEIESIHVTTNGLLLKKMASELLAAGVDGVNISLDSLRADRFKKISRREGLDKVLKGLSLALKIGFSSVKVNVVAMRGFNDDEIGDFIELTKNSDLTVRFIELMPFDAHQIWKTGKFIGAEEIMEILHTLYPKLHTVTGSSTEEQIYQVGGYRGKISVIPSFTRSFCNMCNRVRLTADGRIRNCLYSDNEINIRDLMRSGAKDEDISLMFKQAMWLKQKDGWEAQKLNGHHRESMTQIGG
ncbi:MAG TPA: GTP 3',8-cyclase MoaA [Candidatus Marinimicrobia bacterium]|jgi:cyclic pyranopterin phosphate synthase|nr:GTP 3',8-cyclase MoaA [Candidatus Neomarinimicrobiota bacterium]|tara:strand:+ start:700 stop:1740 length:1041 start_codon:yes stop_codon:yes gene_type:complete